MGAYHAGRIWPAQQSPGWLGLSGTWAASRLCLQHSPWVDSSRGSVLQQPRHSPPCPQPTQGVMGIQELGRDARTAHMCQWLLGYVRGTVRSQGQQAMFSQGAAEIRADLKEQNCSCHPQPHLPSSQRKEAGWEVKNHGVGLLIRKKRGKGESYTIKDFLRFSPLCPSPPLSLQTSQSSSCFYSHRLSMTKTKPSTFPTSGPAS